MPVAVATDLVPRGDYFPDRARVSLRHPTQHKEGSFGAPRGQEFQSLIELTLNPRRKGGLSALIYRRLYFGRVKVFLDVDGHGI